MLSFKKILGLIFLVVLAALIGLGGFLFFRLKNIPAEVTALEKRIESTEPEDLATLSSKRRELFSDFDDFILDTTAPRGWGRRKLFEIPFLKSTKLLNLRLEKLAEEISKTEVSEGSIRLWYAYNMGIIAKSPNVTVGFDLAGPIYSSQVNDLAKLCDIIVVSHGHGDHFDPLALRTAAKNGATIVLPHGPTSGALLSSIVKKITPKTREQIIDLPLGETITIEGARITAYETDHRGDPWVENAWFVIDLADIRIVHTGDGMLKDRNWKKVQPIDVFLMNEYFAPLEMRDSGASLIIPLHLHELTHNRRFLMEAQYGKFLGKYEEVKGTIPDTQVIPLFWGESTEIETPNRPGTTPPETPKPNSSNNFRLKT